MNSLKGSRLTILRKNGECSLLEPKTNLITIGSDIKCTIRFKTTEVKSLHCKIIKDNENKILIQNFCKINPVKVNNEVVLNKTLLSNGDVIEILNIKIKWQPKKNWTQAVMTGRLSGSESNQSGKVLRKKVCFFFVVESTR